MTRQDPRYPPGRYVNGRLEMPLRRTDGSERESPPQPQPRCLECQTQLVQIKDYWRCGNYPHCHFRVTDAVIQEAIRRYVRRQQQVNTVTASG